MDSGDSNGCSSYWRNKLVNSLDKYKSLRTWKKYAILVPIFLNTALFPSNTDVSSAKRMCDESETQKIMRSTLEEEKLPKIVRPLTLEVLESKRYVRYHTLEEKIDNILTYSNPKNVKTHVDYKIGRLLNSQDLKKELEISLSNLSAFEDYIEEASRETSLGVNFIKAFLAQESMGNLEVVSYKGATGLGGMMKLAAMEMELKVTHHVDERYDPKSIIKGSAKYMKEKCIERFGDIIVGLIAYNWGPTNVYDNLYHITKSDDLINNNRIPEESRWYVINVLSRMKIFSNPTLYNLNFEKKPLFSSMFYDEHTIMKDISFKQLAKLYKVDIKTLKKVNPAVRSEIIPKGTVVKIPHES